MWRTLQVRRHAVSQFSIFIHYLITSGMVNMCLFRQKSTFIKRWSFLSYCMHLRHDITCHQFESHKILSHELPANNPWNLMAWLHMKHWSLTGLQSWVHPDCEGPECYVETSDEACRWHCCASGVVTPTCTVSQLITWSDWEVPSWPPVIKTLIPLLQIRGKPVVEVAWGNTAVQANFAMTVMITSTW